MMLINNFIAKSGVNAPLTNPVTDVKFATVYPTADGVVIHAVTNAGDVFTIPLEERESLAIVG